MRTFVSQTEEQSDTVYCTIYLPIHVTSSGFLCLYDLYYLQLNSTQLDSSILTPLPSLLTSSYTDLQCGGCADGKAEDVVELSIRGGRGRQYECYKIQGRKTRLNHYLPFPSLPFPLLFCSAPLLCFLLFSSLLFLSSSNFFSSSSFISCYTIPYRNSNAHSPSLLHPLLLPVKWLALRSLLAPHDLHSTRQGQRVTRQTMTR